MQDLQHEAAVDSLDFTELRSDSVLDASLVVEGAVLLLGVAAGVLRAYRQSRG